LNLAIAPRDLGGVIVRAVIDDNDLCRRSRLVEGAFNRGGKKLSLPEAWDDYGYAHGLRPDA
ncbi:MAG: hypothetical protein M3438_05610, partial [Pseudomonadota bacterium]|nr:hypothetical protein [Pseudomonadota bacterium]